MKGTFMNSKTIHRKTGKLAFFKSLAEYTGLVKLRDSKNKLTDFWVFDKLKKDIESAVETGAYNNDTTLEVAHIINTPKHKNGEKFNKIVDVNKAKESYEILSGTISNINNVRAENRKNKYVYYCLKNKGEKVIYLYMHKELANSTWFEKGNSVVVEAYKQPDQGEHKVYEVKSLFSSNK